MLNINKRKVRREIIKQMVLRECACEDEDMYEDMPMSHGDIRHDGSSHMHSSMMGGGQGKVFDHNGPEAESNMIRSNLYTMAKKSRAMHDMIGMSDDLPEWVQEKIAVASAMMDSVSDYLDYEYLGSEGTQSVIDDDVNMDDMDDMGEMEDEEDMEHFDMLDENDEDFDDMVHEPWSPLRQSTGIMFFEDDQD